MIFKKKYYKNKMSRSVFKERYFKELILYLGDLIRQQLRYIVDECGGDGTLYFPNVEFKTFLFLKKNAEIFDCYIQCFVHKEFKALIIKKIAKKLFPKKKFIVNLHDITMDMEYEGKFPISLVDDYKEECVRKIIKNFDLSIRDQLKPIFDNSGTGSICFPLQEFLEKRENLKILNYVCSLSNMVNFISFIIVKISSNHFPGKKITVCYDEDNVNTFLITLL
jgi:hypothetical protein